MSARALAQHFTETRRSATLRQHVAECRVSKLLQRVHAIKRQSTQGVPVLGIELDAPADQAASPLVPIHHPAFLARVLGAGSAACLPTGFALAFPPFSSIRLHMASIRFTRPHRRTFSKETGNGCAAADRIVRCSRTLVGGNRM